MNNNNFFNMIRNSTNPQQLVLMMLESRIGNTPFGKNLITLAKENQTQQIEQIARNMLKSNGKDFDKEFNEFKNNLGLK